MIPFQDSTKKKLARAGAAVSVMLMSGAAMATETAPGTGEGAVPADAFNSFAATVMSWANGSLGTGLAITMLLVGTGMGIARNSPMPALSGVAGAAFLNWGPKIILSLTGGALV